MTKQEKALLMRALKICLGLCSEQATAWLAVADDTDLRESHYVNSDFTLPDGARFDVSIGLRFYPGTPRRRPLMIEGPKG